MATLKQTPEWYERVFGQFLARCAKKDSEQLEIDAIINNCDVVGVYFTSDVSEVSKLLLELYGSLNKSEKVRKRLEIIQISFTSSSQDVPWFALSDDKTERLLRRYGIQDPSQESLVLLDSFSGDVITTDGLERLQGDPTGQLFPWAPRHIAEILQEARFINARQEQVDYTQFQDKIKGFYFSANWCPPCRAFTPQLAETYNCINAKDPQLEVIMVSSDRSPESFNTYLCSMPWLAVSYEQQSLRRELASLFGVGGIPTLVLLDKDNRVITSEGRAEVNEDPTAHNFPWRPKSVNLLTERYAAKLCDQPAVIIFIEGDEEEIEFAETSLQPAAEEQTASKYNKLLFLIGCDSDASDRLREFVCLDDTVPLLTLVDIPGNRVAALDDVTDITQETVRTLVRCFKDGTLEMQNITRQFIPNPFDVVSKEI